jgi:fatty acid desaturase/membrane-associated phospholipid phosphatase
MVLTGGLYALATRAPYRVPIVIEPSAIDALIAFVPSAAPVYVTYGLLLPALIIVARHRQYFDEVFAIAMGCGLSNAIVYNVVPTRIAERTVAPEGSLLSIIQQLDTTLGAIPSGHVALPAAIVTAALAICWPHRNHDSHFWRRTAAAFALWTAAIAVSTLLTKQHVFVDVVGGLVFGPAIAMIGAFVVKPAEVRRRVARGATVYAPTVVAFLFEWSLIASTVAVALRWWSWPVVAAAALVIATRQHAILILYHDGVHGLIARSRRLNDFLVNSAVGVPLLAPIHLYRALHLVHHAHLGAPDDPERVLLYRGEPWTFRPLRGRQLVRQLAGDVLGWHSIALVIRYVRERWTEQHLKLPRSRAYPELILQFLIFVTAIGLASRVWPVQTLRVGLLWFGTYLTVTQLLQKIRSYAEHVTEDVDPSLSCSWAPGILGRLTIWPYNINYHREHHAHPMIPWDQLPAAFPSVEQRPGRDLVAHLWSGAVR